MRVPGGNEWKFNEDNAYGALIFNMMNAAQTWGKTPSEFFSLSSEDKAMMIVYSNVMSKMKAASASAARKQAKRKTVKGAQ